MHPTSLPLSQIRTDGGTQLRCRPEEKLLQEYSAAMQRGEPFPPVVVFSDGTEFWLADGFHRLEAARRIGLQELAVDVRTGTRRDALLYAAGANAQHGLRRTTADKRRAVQALLDDPEWRCWSDREIAQQCAVDHKTVGRLRRELSGEIPQMDRTVRRSGSVYQQQVRCSVPPVAPATGAPGCEAGAVNPLERRDFTDVLRVLREAPSTRAVYRNDWFRLGAHRLHCGSLGTEKYCRRAPRAQLGILVADAAESGAREAEQLAQLADRVAIITTPAALPVLIRQLKLPHQHVVALVHAGEAPRRATQLQHWTPLLLAGPGAPAVLPPDLLRIPDAPREAGHPFRPSCELLRAVVEQCTRPGETILGGSLLDELLLLTELTGRVFLGAEPDVRRLGSAMVRWERFTGSQAELLVR